MERSKTYIEKPLKIDFNPEDRPVDEHDPEAVLELIFFPDAVSPRLRKLLGLMMDSASEAQRIREDFEDGKATQVELDNAESKSADAESGFLEVFSKVIKSWSLTENGVPIPFTAEALQSEGYKFIFKISSAVFAAISPNPETETASSAA